VKITEKHYAPFVKARQEQLAHSARKAWEKPDEQIIATQVARKGSATPAMISRRVQYAVSPVSAVYSMPALIWR